MRKQLNTDLLDKIELFQQQRIEFLKQEPFKSEYKKRLKQIMARVVCARVLLRYGMLSNSKAKKIADALLKEAYSFGISPYVVMLFRLEYSGKARLKEILSYFGGIYRTERFKGAG